MKFIPNSATRKIARQLLLAKKGSPRVMFVGGLVGVVGTTVLACKATLKLEETLEETKNNLDLANNLSHDSYTEEDRTKDKAYIYIRSGVALGKLYAPALVLGTVSVAALAGSHNILSKRNVALTAAYAAVEKTYNEYRERVLADVGEEKERGYRYPLEACEIEDEKGKKKTVRRVAAGAKSQYAKFFDSNSQSWSITPEYNVLFLRCQQNYANDRLRAKGHLFLNEVYDMLGVDRTTAGSVVGWLWRDGGDDFVDFGIFDSPANDKFYDFVTGHEGGVWLDFNVDGVIYEKI